MVLKRIIVCLDVRDGRTTKGVRFQSNKDVGDPVEMARRYYEEGIDEIVFYDITASCERRSIILEVVKEVSKNIFIPITVGGGIKNLSEIRAILLAGVEKVSLNSQAVCNPHIIEEAARRFGNQCIVVGMDVQKDIHMPSEYRVFINGGRTRTDIDALEWAKKVESLGAGEIVLNSMDMDGTQEGYEIDLTQLISDSLHIPVVASGGAGKKEHIYDIFKKGHADAALLASVLHYGLMTVNSIKSYLYQEEIPIRVL